MDKIQNMGSAIYGREVTIQHLQGEIDKLAAFILEEVPDEPSESQGAVDTAIRIIRDQQKAIAELQEKLTVANDALEGYYHSETPFEKISRERGHSL